MKFHPINNPPSREQLAAMSDEERAEFLEECQKGVRFEDAKLVQDACAIDSVFGAIVAFALGFVRMGRRDVLANLSEFAEHLSYKTIAEEQAKRGKALSDAPPSVTDTDSDTLSQSDEAEVWAEVFEDK